MALESNICEDIPVTHCIMEWLLENSVDVINKYQIGEYGKSAYERVKGRAYRGEVMELCTPVMHRVSGKVHRG